MLQLIRLLPLGALAMLVLLSLLSGCGGSGSSDASAPSASSAPGAVSSSSSTASSTGVSSLASSASTSAAILRATADRPDKFVDQYQVHVIYAVPSDKLDQQRDTQGVLALSLRAANHFFAQASDQQSIRFDETEDGHLDVSFLRLPNDDNYYASKLAFAREAVQADVRAAGFSNARKIYLVYYEGSNESSCGNAPNVGSGDGVTVLYLHGLASYQYPCDGNAFSRDINVADYWEFVPLHEVVHTLGFVDSCAPHGQTQPSHTSDDPSDLMYAGSQAWRPAVIDPGRDDYYGANVPKSCSRNLMFSAFLEPQLGTEVPVNFPHN